MFLDLILSFISIILLSAIIGFLIVFIISKIFRVNLNVRGFIELSTFVIFFPISILFVRVYYKIIKKGLKNTNKKIIILILMLLIVSRYLIASIDYILPYKPFQVSGQSMYSTLYDKEFVLTTKIGGYNRFDIIVAQREGYEYGISRIIGMPGDSIKIDGGEVYLKEKGEEEYIILDEKYLNEENKGNTFVGYNETVKTYSLGENEYFLMGDNRNHSVDSRECFHNCISGFSNYISSEEIVGKVFFDLGYFNFKNFEYKHPYFGIDTSPKYFFDGK